MTLAIKRNVIIVYGIICTDGEVAVNFLRHDNLVNVLAVYLGMINR